MLRSFSLCCFIAATFASRQAAAQPAAVAGSVRDSAGKPLAGAAIVLVGAKLGVVSDDSGRFRFAGLAAGTSRLFARRIGFLPETLAVVVAADGSGHADFRLETSAAMLEADVIEADPLRGKMAAFNRRKSRGVGAFVTRADIEKRNASSLSEVLRYLPGVGVQQRMAGEPQPIRMQRSANATMQPGCTVQLYVDGHPYPHGNVDDFAPNTVEGVEVYRSASEIPGDFRTRDATCGVIAIWTRDPEAARRRP